MPCPGRRLPLPTERRFTGTAFTSPNQRNFIRLHITIILANKIVAELPNEAIARKIAEQSGCKLQCYRGEKWYSFLPSGSGKTAAIEALSKISGISIEDIVAFGDDSNDVEMLKLCGKGIAVANAVPAALTAADDITMSNDEDGVAHWLKVNCIGSNG